MSVPDEGYHIEMCHVFYTRYLCFVLTYYITDYTVDNIYQQK